MISSTSEIKTFLNITGSSFTSLLTDATKYGDGYAVNVVGQPIEIETISRVFMGNNKYHFILPERQVDSINSIDKKEFNKSSTSVSTYELIGGDSYRVVFEEKTELDSIYTISYDVGWSTIPDLITKLANYHAIRYVLESWTDKEFERFGLESKAISNNTGNMTINYVDNISELEQRVRAEFGTWI